MVDETTEYKLIRYSPTYAGVLEGEVNQHIREGWQPHGNLILTSVDKQDILIQPMVRKKPDIHYKYLNRP